MYVWKCWRDTRTLMVVFLLALVIFPSTFTISFSSHIKATSGPVEFVRGETPEKIKSAAQSSWDSFVAFGLFFIVLAAASLGSTGIGDDFRQGTLDYLLTRPRSRGYFVWRSWAVGMVELAALLICSILVRYAILVYITGSPWTWRMAGAVPLLWCVAVASYGLSCFLTMVMRNGRIGLTCSLLAILGYVFVSTFVGYVWKIHLPSPASGLSDWFFHPSARFLIQRVLTWTIVGIIFPLASQLIFERAEL